MMAKCAACQLDLDEHWHAADICWQDCDRFLLLLLFEFQWFEWNRKHMINVGRITLQSNQYFFVWPVLWTQHARVMLLALFIPISWGMMSHWSLSRMLPPWAWLRCAFWVIWFAIPPMQLHLELVDTCLDSVWSLKQTLCENIKHAAIHWVHGSFPKISTPIIIIKES